ncbi:MAG: amidase [Planctomycetota bacterium]|nr:amidase [Planctomycetota bacterium]
MTNSHGIDDIGQQAADALNRRTFVKFATAFAAGTAATSLPAEAMAADDQAKTKVEQNPKSKDKPKDEPKSKPPEPAGPPPLANSWAPAIQFQPAVGGSGAFLDGLTKDQRAAARQKIEVAAWQGAVPASETEIAFLPVHRLAALIQAKKLSPVKLTDIYLKRLKELDPKLLCVVTLMEESARKEAQHAETEINQGRYRGVLHGIPWGVKDLFSTKGVPTTWGTKPYEHRIIDEDAEIVVRLREAGAVLLAKLATGVLALGDNWFRGKTRNPWNTEEGSSGSSAGPGSATAAGCVGFAIGTETRGSIVSPSRRCGISALRPTFGRVSRHGGMTLAWSMDKVGPMCRAIEDCAIVFNAIHGADAKDPSTVTAPFHFDRAVDLSKLSIGYLEGTDEAFLEKLKELGAKPKLLASPPSTRGVSKILAVEGAAAFDEFIAKDLDKEMVHEWRAREFRTARSITAVDYLNNQRRRLDLMRRMDKYMDGIDAYVSPSGDVALTNLTGHPAAIVPYTFAGGQPRCMTLIGRLFADDMLLAIAQRYQAATEWHLKHPEIA